VSKLVGAVVVGAVVVGAGASELSLTLLMEPVDTELVTCVMAFASGRKSVPSPPYPSRLGSTVSIWQ